ncbi:MAG: hypothetical protein IJW30_06620 [Clostridia bacterium]|nr:hypothetical protein [Clostridia bacterium]MBQ9774322.1 hypothetical protein [Clostridia bacterium]
MIPITELQKTMEDNNTVVRLLSEYINLRPRFLTAEMVDSLSRECEVSRDEAFRTLFVAACGLDTCDNREHRRLEREYFLPSLRRLDPAPYREDAYVKTIRFPSQRLGKWETCDHFYAPYEPFVWNHPVVTSELREIPQIGYFAAEFRFPAVLENGIEWMTVTPNEVETMRAPIAESHGHVLTLGLGLGYFAFHACNRPEVERVTVVERSKDVIELFRTHILSQFPHGEKLRILQADAFDYMAKEMPREAYDFCFADLWHDPSDGLDMYLRLKKFEPLSPTTRFSYWIEPSLLSVLRHMVFSRITDPHEPLQLRGVAPETLLTNDFLRSLDIKRI